MNYYTYANAHAHAIFYFHAHAHEYTHAEIQDCSAQSYGGKLAAFMPSAWLRLTNKGKEENEKYFKNHLTKNNKEDIIIIPPRKTSP